MRFGAFFYPTIYTANKYDTAWECAIIYVDLSTIEID